MKIRIRYETVSGRKETITVTANTAQQAIGQAQLMEREPIKRTISIEEVKE